MIKDRKNYDDWSLEMFGSDVDRLPQWSKLNSLLSAFVSSPNPVHYGRKYYMIFLPRQPWSCPPSCLLFKGHIDTKSTWQSFLIASLVTCNILSWEKSLHCKCCGHGRACIIESFFGLCLQPPLIVLNVVVIEAKDLEAKDSDGFSDPYCMLGIRPGVKHLTAARTSSSPQYSPKMNRHEVRRRWAIHVTSIRVRVFPYHFPLSEQKQTCIISGNVFKPSGQTWQMKRPYSMDHCPISLSVHNDTLRRTSGRPESLKAIDRRLYSWLFLLSHKRHLLLCSSPTGRYCILLPDRFSFPLCF